MSNQRGGERLVTDGDWDTPSSFRYRGGYVSRLAGIGRRDEASKPPVGGERSRASLPLG